MSGGERLPSTERLSIVAVEYVGDHRLALRFSDGVEGVVDLAPHLEGPAFEDLRDPARFSRVFLLDGYTVGWPNGADLAPEFLYAITRPTGPALKRDLLRSLHDAEGEYAAQCDRMPEISRFFGIVIRMFYDDHVPPHFHARYGKHTVTVDIRDGSIHTHSFPARALRLVLDWHELHRAALMENWERMRGGKAPNPIAPLE